MYENKEIRGFVNHYAFLSNFYPVQIEYEGIIYPSSENAYQAAKTLDFIDRDLISNMTAGQSKRFGRTVEIREDWEDIKLGVMQDILEIKFQNPECRQLLIDTGDAYIEETNHWGDTYWGVSGGKGENHLGILLMNIRKKLNESI